MGEALVTAGLTAIYPTREERLDFQFNPVQLRERIAVNYNSVLPYRSSHEVSNYAGTSSERIPLTLFYTLYGRTTGAEFPKLKTPADTAKLRSPFPPSPGGRRFGVDVLSRQPVPEGLSASLEGPARFLKSLCYSDPNRNMLSPPVVIFEWPDIIKIAGRVEDLDIGYDHFDQTTLQGLVLVARLVLREDFPRPRHPEFRRITSLGVRRSGSIRPPTVLQAAAHKINISSSGQAEFVSVLAPIPLRPGPR